MIYRSVHRYVITLVLICFSILVHPLIPLAKTENNSKQQTFSKFEKEILGLINSSIDSLNKSSEGLDEESLYNIALSAEQKLAENLLALAQLKVPAALPDDIKTSLERIKSELSAGFKALEKSMNQLAQYIVNRAPLLYDKSIENYDKGFLYIGGVLTSLTILRMQVAKYAT